MNSISYINSRVRSAPSLIGLLLCNFTWFLKKENSIVLHYLIYQYGYNEGLEIPFIKEETTDTWIKITRPE